MPREGSSIAAIGIWSVAAVTRKPSGAWVTASPCDIQTVSVGGRSCSNSSAPRSSSESEVAPYSR